MVKRLIALILVLVGSQWAVFASHKDHLASFSIPWFGTVGLAVTILIAHAFLYLAFDVKAGERRHKIALISSLISIGSAAASVFRGSFVDQLLLGLLAVVYSFISLYLLSLTHDQFGALTEIFAVPIRIALGWYYAAVRVMTQVWEMLTKRTAKNVKVKPQVLTSVIIGAVVTIPVLFVLIGLLSSADPVFSKLAGQLFSLKWLQIKEWLILRSLFAILMLFVALPLIFLKISYKYKSPLKNDSELSKLPIAAYILGGSVSLVLAIFLIIQFQYLFAQVDETQLHQFGVNTYSEYVRRGFSELLAVSVVIYGVSGLCFSVYRSLKNKAQSLRLLNLLLLSEMLIFIFSIFRRIYLYQLEHGFTRIRIYGSAFLVVMILMTVMLLLRHFRPKFQWYLAEFGAATLVIFLVSVINVDSLIANALPPTVNREVDYVYISKLSSDAKDGWRQSYNHATAELIDLSKSVGNWNNDQKRRVLYAFYTLNNLRNRYENLTWRYGTDEELAKFNILKVKRIPPQLKSQNLVDYQAYSSLKREIPFAELHSQYMTAQHYSQLIPANEVYIYLDRGLNSPLTY